MARLLICAGTRKALEKYDMAGVPVLYGMYGRKQNERALAAFNNNPHGMLVVSAQYLTTGFRVPSDTFIVFDSSWPYGPNDPHTIQAKGRAARLEPPTSYELSSLVSGINEDNRHGEINTDVAVGNEFPNGELDD